MRGATAIGGGFATALRVAVWEDIGVCFSSRTGEGRHGNGVQSVALKENGLGLPE
jgi:hypothetical protein